MEKVSDYRYELPPELVASRPAERRDASRMLVLHRASGQIGCSGISQLSLAKATSWR